MTIDSLDIAPAPTETARRAYQASLLVGKTEASIRNRAIQALTDELENQQENILEANTLDLEASRDMAVPNLVLDWLKLTPERLQTTVQILRRLVQLTDPIGQVMNAAYQVDSTQTYCQSMPLGAIALIYEAFPELGAIAAGMCLKTGNSLILKGSTEASHTNLAIAQVLTSALTQANLPPECLQHLPSDRGDSIRELVRQDRYLSLVIPYGRPSLIQSTIEQATVPVLPSAMGNCYLYWSPSGDWNRVREIVIDSHQSQPDPVNAIEKVLIHRDLNPASVAMLLSGLRDKGFEVRGDLALVEEFPELKLAQDSEWRSAYLTRTVALKRVESLEIAIAIVDRDSSGHAATAVTQSYRESCQFTLGVNSASTYINASPRFIRNPKQGHSILLGMSNRKGHHRGFIGLESFTTVKHIIQGHDCL
ncbi:glutamate-5-semialdehyde dehydrogenase [Oscillatoriales cyanobacterium LEGE 11467]|uniref:Gamma-glutamyl phosphate reductase n=1 Tax=Zarconia navalis LEGE 11467 TaxID=1828826 RepID=A0A928VXG0_9CYAN|nr:glutamate-5-semialdehyde dehydrogenase [Zarconia navalis]MBE9040051.1 glutamate-5-semialdehyde dehydrogenase [Zarconia navalis LEGE 11467]